MKSDVLKVAGGGTELEAALCLADKVAAYKQLSTKSALHLRLLTEEMIGMMRSLTGEPTGEFWIEDEDERGEYHLHLRVFTRMNSGKREQLLAASTSGKNESARGLMGWIRDFFDRSADEDLTPIANPLFLPDMADYAGGTALDWEWSMTQYEDSLVERIEQNDAAARAAWDELEKSVVVHVADEVKVSIRGDTVEMTIIKKMA